MVIVAFPDSTRPSYVEVLPDEKRPITVGFLCRIVPWFIGQVIVCRRVLSDNGSTHALYGWRISYQVIGMKAKKTKP
jgi:hypothetical protein